MISLEVIQLEKSFGPKTVFSDLSFIHEGSLGIAGPNGSGKSTLLKCIAFLQRPTNGQIKWKNNGEVLSNENFKKKLGYAAPYINLYDELTCRENLEFLAKVRHNSDNLDTITHWIPKVELEHVADQPFGKLSTGQQQRLRLASALFHEPDILMLDEPGSNLDEGGRELIKEIAQSFKSPEKMLIVASNNQDELNLCEQRYSIEQEEFI